MATRIADAIDVGHLLFALGVRQQGNQFGDIHRAAAAKADDQLGLHVFGLSDRFQYNMFRRIGLYLIKYFDAHLRLGHGR